MTILSLKKVSTAMKRPKIKKCIFIMNFVIDYKRWFTRENYMWHKCHQSTEWFHKNLFMLTLASHNQCWVKLLCLQKSCLATECNICLSQLFPSTTLSLSQLAYPPEDTSLAPSTVLDESSNSVQCLSLLEALLNYVP